MKRFILILASICVPALALGKGHVGVRAGLNICQDNGDANCDRTDPGYALTISPGTPLSPQMNFDVDIGLSSMTADSESSPGIEFLHLIPMLRAKLKTGDTALLLGMGIGYSRLKVTNGFLSVESKTWTAIKGSMGLSVPVDQKWSVLLAGDFLFNGDMEVCGGLLRQDDNCKNIEMVSQIQLGMGAVYTF